MSQIGFWATAVTHPERVAVIADDGTTTDYGQLWAEQNRVSNGLRTLGLRRGDTVVVQMRNRVEFLEVSLATAQIGAYLVPVNYQLTGTEVGYILADCKASAFIAEEEFVGAVAAVAPSDLPAADRVFAVGLARECPSYAKWKSEQASTRPPDPTAGASMLYTSGTTGRPKGIRRPLPECTPEQAAQMMAQHAQALVGPMAHDWVHLVTGPLYHATPGGLAVIGLHLGQTVVLMDRWDAERTLELIERHRVSYMHMVPTMFHRLLALPAAVRGRHDVSSLRRVLHGAAPCPVEDKRRMIEWWGRVINEYYGSSEGGGTSVDSEEWLVRPGTVGRPWPGSTIKILDENGDECPPGRPGAVYMSMPGMSFEYHNATEKTRLSRRGEFFTVGDIGYLDEDGYLFLSGRTAELIISGGVNIYPAEIENALLTHAAVADVAVIGVPNREWGEEVKAVVALQDGYEPHHDLAEQLIAHTRSQVARFKVPRTVDFRPELPRNESGKLEKRRLREAHWSDTGRTL